MKFKFAKIYSRDTWKIQNFMPHGIAVSLDVGIVNLSVFWVIWMHLHHNFHNHTFRHCENFQARSLPPPPSSKSRSARMPMALPLALFRFLAQRAKGKEELLGRVLILTVTKLLHWSCVLKASVFEYQSITSIDPYALLTSWSIRSILIQHCRYLSPQSVKSRLIFADMPLCLDWYTSQLTLGQLSTNCQLSVDRDVDQVSV